MGNAHPVEMGALEGGDKGRDEQGKGRRLWGPNLILELLGISSGCVFT